jgi:2-polyprenyl-6-methoxyphenol hydroxylase-like FAD-dependent oxidoreductase
MGKGQSGEPRRHDVAVVGAGIAGCTAATLFAQRGLDVALIERHPDPNAYKKLCTHFIQASATPTIERLGLAQAIRAAGGLPNPIDIWSRWGWSREPPVGGGHLSHGYNMRREKLDPMLRTMAAGTPGVDLMLGQTVRRLLTSEGRVSGIHVEGQDGRTREIRARLVVAADGRTSRVAQLAGIPATAKPNNRFIYFAYYRNLCLSSGTNSQMWFLGPDMAYAFPNDEGLTLLAAIPTKDKLPAFKHDIERSFVRFVEALPDGPDVREAERVSEFRGIIEYPNTWRPAARPGLALIGDAAVVADYVWGVGIGWAFQSAAWLVDATAESLLSQGDVDRALSRYRKRHRSALRGHYWAITDFATGRPLNPVEKLFLSAATKDRVTARHLRAFGSRSIGVLQFLSPLAIARALGSNVRHRII